MLGRQEESDNAKLVALTPNQLAPTRSLAQTCRPARHFRNTNNQYFSPHRFGKLLATI